MCCKHLFNHCDNSQNLAGLTARRYIYFLLNQGQNNGFIDAAVVGNDVSFLGGPWSDVIGDVILVSSVALTLMRWIAHFFFFKFTCNNLVPA